MVIANQLKLHLAIGSTLLAVLVPGHPASAGKPGSSLQDPRGDAVARFDLGRVSVVYDVDTVTVRATVRALDAQGTQIFGYTASSTEDPADAGPLFSSDVTTVRHPSGKVSSKISATQSVDNSRSLCASALGKWLPRTNQIVLKAPRACLPNFPVDFNFYIGAGNGSSGDPADFTDLLYVQ